MRERLGVLHERRAPPTPRSNGRGGVSVGFAGPPSRKRTSAVSSPATKPSGTASDAQPTRASSRRSPARRSHAASAAQLQLDAPPTATTAVARTERRGGERRRRRGRGAARSGASARSLPLAGSPSAALTTTSGAAARAATAAQLRGRSGSRAPPRPRRPLRSTSSIRSRPTARQRLRTAARCASRSTAPAVAGRTPASSRGRPCGAASSGAAAAARSLRLLGARGRGANRSRHRAARAVELGARIASRRCRARRARRRPPRRPAVEADDGARVADARLRCPERDGARPSSRSPPPSSAVAPQRHAHEPPGSLPRTAAAIAIAASPTSSGPDVVNRPASRPRERTACESARRRSRAERRRCRPAGGFSRDARRSCPRGPAVLAPGRPCTRPRAGRRRRTVAPPGDELERRAARSGQAGGDGDDDELRARRSASSGSQPERASDPEPSPWTSASGQVAYAPQCSARHVR